MDNRKFISLLTLIILIACVYSYFEHKKKPKPYENIHFESQVATTMNLELVGRNSLYRQPYNRIFKDTLVGYYAAAPYDVNDSNYYFIQSLNKTRQIKKIKIPGEREAAISSIDVLKNGCIFFGEFGKNRMQNICSDGSRKTFFNNYESDIFYLTKVFFFKNIVAGIAMNGVYIFDLQSEKLLWKYKFIKDTQISLSALSDSKLIFTETPGKGNNINLLVHCIDLNQIKQIWVRDFKGTSIRHPNIMKFHEQDALLYNSSVVCIPANSLYFLDIGTGKIVWKWEADYGNVKLNENYAFFDVLEGVRIFYFKTKTTKVPVRNLLVSGVLGDLLIMHTSDLKFYVIMDITDQKIKYRIKRTLYGPETQADEINVVDNYIVINDSTIYRKKMLDNMANK